MQVGELTGELKRTTRRYVHLNTLKSVLSESSVADVNQIAISAEMESPKSAENVFNPKTESEQNSGQLKRKKSTEEVAEMLETEMLGKLAEIDHWLVNPEDNSDSTNSMGKRSISPMCPSSSCEIFDGRFQTIGSQSTLNQVAEHPTTDRNLTRSNRSSSLRSGRASIRTRCETPVTPARVQNCNPPLFDFWTKLFPVKLFDYWAIFLFYFWSKFPS